MYDVVGIDMPCMDLLTTVDSFPKPNGGARVNSLSWQGGNKVSTGMVAAARLGARCAILGAVGDDSFGRFCLWDFEQHGIDTSGMVVRSNTSTSLSIVISDRETGGRSFVFHHGSAGPCSIEEIDHRKLEQTRFFFVSNMDETAIWCCTTAKQAGAEIFIDADTYSEAMMEQIHLIDYFIASEFVYEALFSNRDYEENCRKILDMGPKAVVFTLGGKGCVGLCDEGFFKLETYPVEVVDTTGAGDVFHGAFLAGLLQGWTIRQCSDFSNAVASIKCTRQGGRAGIPDMATALKFMETGKIDYTEIDKRVELYKRGLSNVGTIQP